MDYQTTQTTFCYEAATIIKEIIESLGETQRHAVATDCMLIFHQSCTITYNASIYNPISVIIHLYNDHGVKIDLNAQRQHIVGYVNDKEYISLAIDSDIMKTLSETMIAFVSFLIHNGNISPVLQSDQTYIVSLNT